MSTYIFTFGSNHATEDGMSLGNYYVEIEGTYGEARQKLVEARGSKWAFQYDTKEEAGVSRFNLMKVSLDMVALDD